MTRADKLKPKDRLRIGGVVWTVTKVKAKGSNVKLTVTGRAGEFTSVVKAKAKYEVMEKDPIKQVIKDGKKKGWYKGPPPPEPPQVAIKSRKIKPPVKPDWTPDKRSWSDKDKVDKVIAKSLGGRLVAVKTKDGEAYAVPQVDSASIAAHLLAFHGVTVDGVSLKEARAMYPDAERMMSMDQTMSLAAAQRAREVHDLQHAEFEAGRLELPVPHFHTKERPQL